MSLTFNVQIDTTNADKEDQNAAKLIVDGENERRIAEAAAQEPPVEPELLPTEPATALLDSYRIVWSTYTCPTTHNSYRNQGTEVTNKIRGEAFNDAPESVQDQVDALLEPYIPT